MSEDTPQEGKPQWPDWNEPATKGDVLTAMIWTEALILVTLRLLAARMGGDTAKIKEAFEAWQAEIKDFDRKKNEIGGVVQKDE